MKNCKNNDCTQINPQPLANFYNEKGMKDGKRSQCKTCRDAKVVAGRKANPKVYNGYMAKWRKLNPDKQHATEIKRNYGLSIEDYNDMLTAQACKCKICGKPHDPSLKRGRLYVDHDHKTGAVRGLLCGACNSAIGYFNDDIDLLLKAIDYINSSKKAA